MTCPPNKFFYQLVAYSAGVSKTRKPNTEKLRGIKLRIYIHPKASAIGISSNTPIEVCEALGYVAQKVLGKINVPDIYPLEAIDELKGGEEIIINLGDRPLEVLEWFYRYYILRLI